MNERTFFKNVRLDENGFLIVKFLPKVGNDENVNSRFLFFKKIGLTINNELKIFI